MDSATAGLVGALIGAGIGFLGGQLTNLFQIRLEKQKWLRSQQDTTSKAIREQIAQVSYQMLAAQHSMEWLTWRANHSPNSLDEKMIRDYEQEIHQSFPALLGALTMIAALDVTIYRQLAEIAESLYAVDAQIAEALLCFGKEPVETSTRVGECLAQATALYQTLPMQIADVLKSVSHTS
jgi:hypothetical protein